MGGCRCGARLGWLAARPASKAAAVPARRPMRRACCRPGARTLSASSASTCSTGRTRPSRSAASLPKLPRSIAPRTSPPSHHSMRMYVLAASSHAAQNWTTWGDAAEIRRWSSISSSSCAGSGWRGPGGAVRVGAAGGAGRHGGQSGAPLARGPRGTRGIRRHGARVQPGRAARRPAQLGAACAARAPSCAARHRRARAARGRRRAGRRAGAGDARAARRQVQRGARRAAAAPPGRLAHLQPPLRAQGLPLVGLEHCGVAGVRFHHIDRTLAVAGERVDHGDKLLDATGGVPRSLKLLRQTGRAGRPQRELHGAGL
jgi:hypothetical protein